MRRFMASALVPAILLATSAEAQSPRRTSAESVGQADEIICRRFLRTGTLADYYRVCKTRSEWDRERRNIRQGIGVSDSCSMRYTGNPLLCPN